MKKSRFALALTALTAIGTLASCSEAVTNRDDDVILSLTLNDGQDVKQIKADDLFTEYKLDPNKTKTYYDAIYEVYVRYLFQDPAYEVTLEQINRDANVKVSAEEENAKSNKETNGTTFDKEMRAIFDSYNVEDKNQLREHFTYQLMKEKVREMYFDAEAAWTKTTGESNTWLDLKNNYLSKKLPYHVKHILVKLSGTSSTIESSRLTAAEATKLSGVVRRLATQMNNETFGDIAREQSDDDGSAERSGNLGIMDRDTSFVNEFKLGIYAYDAVFNQNNAGLDAETKSLLITEDAATKVSELGLVEIPYEAALVIGRHASLIAASDGTSINDGNAAYYPRNVYFNEYFNHHNVGVITPTTLTGVESADYTALAGFNTVEELGGKNVLTDEKGNVILVVKAGGTSQGGSYEGVHFIVVERSALSEVENGVSLSDYYTTSTPGDEAYPVNEAGEPLETYINFMATERTTFQTRANEVSDKIKNHDKLIDYRIFNQLVEKNAIEIHDAVLAEYLDEYISIKFITEKWDADEQFKTAWEKWIQLLDYQQHQRDTRLVDVVCAEHFLNYASSDEAKAAFATGGACYVK